MVDAELGRDLMSFGVPVLVLGDPGATAADQGGGFFTDAEPDAMLTEVHRQAQDDPIVRLSMEIRAGNRADAGSSTARPRWSARDTLDPKRVLDADQVLVGRNATRPRLQRAHARAPRLCRAAADGGRQAGLLAQQPPQGIVQRRALGGEGAPASRGGKSSRAAQARRGPGRAADQGVGAVGMLHRHHRGVRLAATQSPTTSSTSAT